MTHHKKNMTLPENVVEMLSTLGSRISIARKRRRISTEELAKRMFVSRKTLYRLEKGDPGISMAIFASALWALGLEKDLLQIAVPEQDKVGVFHERQQLSERIRDKSKNQKLDF